jgi:CRP-like cAMP-binding protein
MSIRATTIAAPREPRDIPFASERSGGNLLLNLLPEADFALLAPYLQELPLKKGRTLQEAGAPIRDVYFPHSGLISLLATLESGHSVEAAMIGRESALGLMAGLGSRFAVSRAAVQAQGTASRIAADRFASIAAQSEALRRLIVFHGENLLAQIQHEAVCNTLHHVEARLCRWLLEARERVGADMLLITHDELAQLLAVRRTTVTVTAHVLQGGGTIHCRRGSITIRDAAGLEKAACECYRNFRVQSERLLREYQGDGGAVMLE